MNAANDNTSAKGFREWWQDPPRSGLRRLINPLAYRHLRLVGILHLAGGCVAAAAGLACLSYQAWGWAAFFLVIAALNFGGGSWYFAIDRSASART
jgi:hypothetical protein